jgi:hypothetical protein
MLEPTKGDAARLVPVTTLLPSVDETSAPIAALLRE